jgi:hypothetical protein
MRQVRMPAGRAFIGARWRRALLVGVGVAAISLATAPGALANTTIGNTPPWTPASGITSGFGVSGAPNYWTPTYGQTVTVPATDTVLDSFTFYVDLPTNLMFRGEVYAWDPNTVDPNNPYSMGTATGGALYESGQTHTTKYVNPLPLPPSVNDFEPITFNIPGGLPLTAGAQYVLFFTTSRDYAANAGITALGYVGVTGADTYSDGDWVYMDDGGDPTLWTTVGGARGVGWTHPAAFPANFAGQDDLAFNASFSSPGSSTCPSTAPTTDGVVSANQTTASATFKSPALTTTSGSDLVLAFVEADGPRSPTQEVTTVTGGGLTWSLAARSNQTWGTTDVWQAFATAPLSAVKVTAKLPYAYDGAITVAAFHGAAPQVGATAVGASKTGTPMATITPQACGSLVWAAGHDWSRSVTPVAAAGQTLVHSFIDHRVRDSFWTQKVDDPTAANAPVTVTTTGPVNDRWTMAAVEIRAAG